MMADLIIGLIFFGIALLYSSVGFGGGSSYLALMALLVMDFDTIRTTALVLNIAVVLVGSFRFYRKGMLEFKSFAPFVVASLVASFLGAQIVLDANLFFSLLGVMLLLAAISMILQLRSKADSSISLSTSQKAGIGATIGVISGMVGIGGGIFLSPVLHLLKWQKAHTVAALSAFFILCNSIAGLIGLSISSQLSIEMNVLKFALPAVILGGLIGNYLLTSSFNKKTIRIMTSLFVAYVGARLIAKCILGVQL